MKLVKPTLNICVEDTGITRFTIKTDEWGLYSIRKTVFPGRRFEERLAKAKCKMEAKLQKEIKHYEESLLRRKSNKERAKKVLGKTKDC